jgi:CubicO group peptidase (beta-lactamase class C family)
MNMSSLLFRMNNSSITSLSESTDPESIIFNEQLIDDFIEKEIQEGFPGAALVITRHGKILKQSVYGYKLKYDENGALLTQPQLLTLDTMFDLASLTKMYATNYALMQLVEQGKLSVDDPVKNYLPEYSGCNPENEYREIRLVRDLLTHTAGYAPSVEFYDPEKVSPDLYSQKKQKTEQIITTKLGFERPRDGDHLPVYSDIDYMLLGLIVEHISGMSIEQYVNINIYQPLGLMHTLFNPLNNTHYQKSDFAATELKGNTRSGTISFPNVRTHVIQGQVHDEKSFYSMNGLSGHAGLFSNLHDMAILCQIMLNNGTSGNIRFWSKNVQDLFVTPYAPDPSFGLGWRLNRNKSLPMFGLYASDEAYGHTGWTGNCSIIDPKYSLVIILLTNKRHTPCVNGIFDGEKYETGKYGKIMTLIYESMLLNKHSPVML